MPNVPEPTWSYIPTTLGDISTSNTYIRDEKKNPIEIGISLKFITEGFVVLHLLASPRGQDYYVTSTGFTIRSSSMPEYSKEGAHLYTWGSTYSRDNTSLHIPKNKFHTIQKAMCEWNLFVSRVHYTQKIICPHCYHVSNNTCYSMSDLQDSFQECDGGCVDRIVNNSLIEYDIVFVSFDEETTLLQKCGSVGVLDLRQLLSRSEHTERAALCCTRCGTKSHVVATIESIRYEIGMLSRCSHCEPYFSVCCICKEEAPTKALIKHPLLEGSYCLKHRREVLCDGCFTLSTCLETKVCCVDDYHTSTIHVCLCDTCIQVPSTELFQPELSYTYKNEQIKGIHTWKGKGIQVPLKKSKIPFMGMEIEQVHGTSSVFSKSISGFKPILNRIICEINKAFTTVFNIPISICKHDGSIPCGTEIVTNPLTLEAWKQVYKSGILSRVMLFCAIPETDKRTIGGHIHLNKAACTKSQIYRMTNFIHKNVEFMSSVCGRVINTSSRWCSTKLAHTPINMVRVNNYASPNRYTALNVTQHTLEHRYFTTPTTPEDVIYNIEFVHALWAASKDKNYLKDVESFFSFVKSSSKEYPVLHKWVTARRKTYSKNELVVTNTGRPYSYTPSSGDEDEEDDCVDRCEECGSSVAVIYYGDCDRFLCTLCTPRNECVNCGDPISTCDYTINDSLFCRYCYENTPTFDCVGCNEHTYSEESAGVFTSSGEEVWCGSCVDDYTSYCETCDTLYQENFHCNCVIED